MTIKYRQGLLTGFAVTQSGSFVHVLYKLLLLGLLLGLKSSGQATTDQRSYKLEPGDGAQVAPLSGEPRLRDSAC